MLSSILLLPLFFTFISAFPLENVQDETAAHPISVTPVYHNAAINPTTTSTTSNLISTSTYIDLPITGERLDPLGIADVSGFYGPGTWAGWYVTVAAASRGVIFEIPPKYMAILLGINWAVYDLLHDIRSAGILKQDSPTYDADLNKWLAPLPRSSTLLSGDFYMQSCNISLRYLSSRAFQFRNSVYGYSPRGLFYYLSLWHWRTL